jgi:hypothetical protein
LNDLPQLPKLKNTKEWDGKDAPRQSSEGDL